MHQLKGKLVLPIRNQKLFDPHDVLRHFALVPSAVKPKHDTIVVSLLDHGRPDERHWRWM